MDIEHLLADLRRDESLKNKPYRDTVGKTTIGIGRNLDDVGISDDEALTLCRNDISRAMADLDRNAPWWRSLSEARQRALANMCFNMGWGRLSGFVRLLAALQAGDWATAKNEALTSKWAAQVGNRASRIALMFEEG